MLRKRFNLAIFSFLLVFLSLLTVSVYGQATGTACNPRQGVWDLYQPATASTCGGERLVYWSEIEPIENQFNWSSLEWYLENTQGQIFLAIPVTASEGRLCSDEPVLTGAQCKGGQDRGVYRKANNRTCQGGCIPNWLEPKMCLVAGLNENCWDSSDQGSRKEIVIEETPIIWNPAFKQAFQNTVNQVGEWLNNHPQYKDKITFIYASSGGGWGEMNLVSWSKEWKNKAWLEAGYTNKKFARHVYDVLDYYNSAFLDLPISVQTGSGMFCYGPGNPPGCDHSDPSGQTPTYFLLHGFDGRPGLIDKYGLKVNIRINGWGSVTSNGTHPQGSGLDNYCSFSCSDPSSSNCSLATCSFESGRGPQNWQWLLDNCQESCQSCDQSCRSCLQDQYSIPVQGSINSHVSIQSVKWNESAGSVNVSWNSGASCAFSTKEILEGENHQLGAQIFVRQPAISLNNRQINFKANFHNQGNRPPFSTKAIGSKWVAQSLKLGFGFYQDNQLKDTALVEPNRPSYFWKKETNENSVEATFSVPNSLPIGSYEVRLFLVDPKTNYHWNFFDSSGNTSMEEKVLGIVNLETNAVISPTLEISMSPIPICSDKSQGDANCDGQIDEVDYDIWQCEFIGSGVCQQYESNKTADFNNDGKIDLVDFEIWRKNFNK